MVVDHHQERLPWWKEVARASILGRSMRLGYLRTHPDAPPSPHERLLIDLVKAQIRRGGPDWSDCLPEPFRHLARA